MSRQRIIRTLVKAIVYEAKLLPADNGKVTLEFPPGPLAEEFTQCIEELKAGGFSPEFAIVNNSIVLTDEDGKVSPDHIWPIPAEIAAVVESQPERVRHRV